MKGGCDEGQSFQNVCGDINDGAVEEDMPRQIAVWEMSSEEFKGERTRVLTGNHLRESIRFPIV